MRGRKGVVRRENEVKRGRKSGECVRIEKESEIGKVKGSRATKGRGGIRSDSWARSIET